MSRFTVLVLPEAEQELRAAFLWYSARSPAAANAFRTDVFEAIDGLADRADMWPSDDGVHFLVLSKWPYTVWYGS